MCRGVSGKHESPIFLLAGDEVRRAAAVLDLLHDVDPAQLFDLLCEACVGEFDITGAGVALILSGQHRGMLGTSDDRSRLLEDLQFTLGEGPCLDAHKTGVIVSEPRLDSSRWPGFAEGALEAGVAAVFAVPLQIGAAGFGALDFYRDAPGPLTSEELDDAMVVADAATVMVLAMRTDEDGDGHLPVELESAVHRRAAVHQAAGMVSVQLDVGIDDAMVLLRARAYRSGQRLGDLADDILARRVRLDES